MNAPAFSFNLSDFVIVWWSLIHEAMPFVLLGSILSGLLERCVSRETIARLFPKNRLVGIGVSAMVGLIFPMCECGIVPVVRRLIRKGVPSSCAVTYMLASPIINPLVILSTVVAFQKVGGWTVAALRVGMGFAVAVVVGWAVWKFIGEGKVLLESTAPSDDTSESRRGNVVLDVLVLAAEDMIVIGGTLVFGAALAALINSGFSREAMTPFAENPLTAVTGMLVLAIGLNLCSEADAFVAASFHAFPMAAKQAFLVLGPMVDLKLIAMYTTVFRIRAVVLIMGLATLLVFLLCVSGYVWIPWVMEWACGCAG